jgi:hypothetical protein
MVHTINGIQLFPANNVFNVPINSRPLDANSAAYVTAVGPTLAVELHFSTLANPPAGAGNFWGIPYNVVTNATPTYHMTSFTFPTISADLAYPIPNSPVYEEGWNGAADHHLLSLNTDTGVLYELHAVVYNSGANTWSASAGGSWTLSSNANTTAASGLSTASGLPILPGLVTYDEAASGVITHAIRCSLPNGAGNGNQIWPAMHGDGSTGGYPPQGIRLRLKANYDISGYSATNRVILQALKVYGAFVEDSGSSKVVFFGVPDSRWNDSDLAIVDAALTMNNFEFVNESSLQIASSSMQAEIVPDFSMVNL